MDRIKEGMIKLRSEKIRRFLEICLAVGSYLNNQKNLVAGFKFSSLAKLMETRAQGSKMNLLHYIASYVEKKHPDILDWPDDVACLSAVPGAVKAIQQDIGFLKGNSNILSKELGAMTDPALANLKRFFMETAESVQRDLAKLDQEEKLMADELAFFGETNTGEIPQFFEQWDKLAVGLKSAVKYNHSLAKKEESLRQKEETKKKKEEEEKVMSKVVNTLRKSQANLKQMKEEKIDGFFSSQSRSRRESSKKSGGDEAVDSLVDDILSNNPAATNRNRRSMREEKGVVKQISKGLRDSRSFSKIRENRGSEKEEEPKDRDKSKAALQRQISSKLTRRR
jgi:hypothetical protein